jgi:hypothetical protein
MREVLMHLLCFLESSGYQCQDGIKHPHHHFSLLGDIQILLNIVQGEKSIEKYNLI